MEQKFNRKLIVNQVRKDDSNYCDVVILYE